MGMAKWNLAFFPVVGCAAMFSDIPVGSPQPPVATTISTLTGSQCVDTGDDSPANGAPLQMWKCLNNSHQLFFSSMTGQSSIGIEAPTGRITFGDSACLETVPDNQNLGAKVHLWECAPPMHSARAYRQEWTYSYSQLSMSMWDPELLRAVDYCLTRPAGTE